jgi:hypothetical protein
VGGSGRGVCGDDGWVCGGYVEDMRPAYLFAGNV